MFFRQALALFDSRIKARYRGAIAGLFWVLFQPISTFLIQFMIFRAITQSSGLDFLVYFASGFFPWYFFMQSCEMGGPAFNQYATLLKSVRISPAVPILAVVLDTCLSFLLAFLPVLVVAFIWVPGSLERAYLLPLALLPLVTTTLATTWLLATLQVFYADIRFITSFWLQVLFFLTPIIYRPEIMPSGWRIFDALNPVSALLRPFRAILCHQECDHFVRSLLHASSWSLVLAAVVFLYWRRIKHVVYYRL